MSEDYQAPSGAEHPITPPPELVQEWLQKATGPDYEQRIATQAARWGADQELEACRDKVNLWSGDGDRLYAARRPKPPSLKEQALKALDSFEGFTGSLEEVDTIRRALNQLPNE